MSDDMREGDYDIVHGKHRTLGVLHQGLMMSESFQCPRWVLGLVRSTLTEESAQSTPQLSASCALEDEDNTVYGAIAAILNVPFEQDAWKC